MAKKGKQVFGYNVSTPIIALVVLLLIGVFWCGWGREETFNPLVVRGNVQPISGAVQVVGGGEASDSRKRMCAAMYLQKNVDVGLPDEKQYNICIGKETDKFGLECGPYLCKGACNNKKCVNECATSCYKNCQKECGDDGECIKKCGQQIVDCVNNCENNCGVTNCVNTCKDCNSGGPSSACYINPYMAGGDVSNLPKYLNCMSKIKKW